MNIWFPLPPIERYSATSGGAIATCVMQVARGLIEQGHRVVVFASNMGDRPYPIGRFVELGLADRRRGAMGLMRRCYGKLRWKYAGQDWPGYDQYVGALKSSFRGMEKPDVVISCNDLQLPSYIKQSLPGAKQVCWAHNEVGTRHASPDNLFASIDRLVANSGYIRDWFAERYGLDRSMTRVAHNGIDLEDYYPRNDWDQPAKPVKVLCLGRIDPNKGADLAAQAVLDLQAKGLAVELTVVGGEWFFKNHEGQDNPYAKKLKGLVQQAGGAYLGHKDREVVPSIVREHDVLCALSRSQEPFGLVVLEGMASGCCVISSGRGGLPEAGGDAGIMVDIDQPDEIANALEKLVCDPEYLVMTKRRSLEHARASGWANTAAKFESISKELLTGGQPVASEYSGAVEAIQ